MGGVGSEMSPSAIRTVFATTSDLLSLIKPAKQPRLGAYVRTRKEMRGRREEEDN